MRSENEPIGKKIEAARLYRKMGRQELADEIHESYRQLLRWETTDREPRLGVLKKISSVLQIDFQYFLDDMPCGSALGNLLHYFSEDERIRNNPDSGFKKLQYKIKSKKILEEVTDMDVLRGFIFSILEKYVAKRYYVMISQIFFELSDDNEDDYGKCADFSSFEKVENEVRQEVRFSAFQDGEFRHMNYECFRLLTVRLQSIKNLSNLILAMKIVIDYSEIDKAEKLYNAAYNLKNNTKQYKGLPWQK